MVVFVVQRIDRQSYIFVYLALLYYQALLSNLATFQLDKKTDTTLFRVENLMDGFSNQIIFERSEFLIDTSQKKSLRVCTRARVFD